MTKYVLERKRVKGQFFSQVFSTPHFGRKEVYTYTATDSKSVAAKFKSIKEATEFMEAHGFTATFKCVEL